MVTETGYGLSRRLQVPYEEALERIKQALKEEEFGVLTEIDVRETLQEKLGADFRRYDIIGACNPALAHRALQVELEIGLLLPCNVIVYEDGDETVITAIDPEAAMAVVGNEAVVVIAREAKERLRRALERVA